MSERGPTPPANRWRSRPILSLSLRALAIMVPAAAGALAAIAAARVFPRPHGAAGWAWIVGVVVLAWIVAAIVERLARRVLPLALLLRLSLVFPDAAPSRYKMARGSGNVRVLEARIQDAKQAGLDDDPARAAAQILALVAALSRHDRKTRGHSERVRAFTDLIVDELHLPDASRDRIRWAALLHDIGKLHVPSRVLNKPGRPTDSEWEALKSHPVEGARIAAPLMGWLGESGSAIAQHHERYDGAGYPNGLAGDEISLVARIVSVADSFEVMTAARTYKKPMSVPAARQELARCAGSQFSPEVVRAFFNISIGRLWWTVGPASWIALLPFLGHLQRAGGQAVVAAKSAAVVASLGAASVVSLAPAAANSQPRPGSAVASAPQPDGTELDAGHDASSGSGASSNDGRGGGGKGGGEQGGSGDGSGSGNGGDDPGGGGFGDGTGTGSGGGTGTGSGGGTGTGGGNGGGTGTGSGGGLTDTVDDVVGDVTGGLLP